MFSGAHYLSKNTLYFQTTTSWCVRVIYMLKGAMEMFGERVIYRKILCTS
jgi:hypothetical protein